jgi:hypothetical protein
VRTTPEPLPDDEPFCTYTVTTLGAAFAAAAVAVVAVCGSWMTTLCAVGALDPFPAGSSNRVTTPAPAPPPMRAPATRPATPIRSRPLRRAGWGSAGAPAGMPTGAGEAGCGGGPQ